MQYSSAKKGLVYLLPWGRIPGLDDGLWLRISLPLPRQIRLISPAESPVSGSTSPGFDGYPGNWYRLNGAVKADGIAIAGIRYPVIAAGFKTSGQHLPPIPLQKR